MNDFWSYLQSVYDIHPTLIKAAREAETAAATELAGVDEVVKTNQLKVLLAFQKAGITEYHLKDGTGYGYDDLGREGLERVYALSFGAQSALVRAQIISGTHAITLALTSILKPGDELLSATGTPYDTLVRIIGTRDNKRSLQGQGFNYREVALTEQGLPDYEGIRKAINERTRVVMIQRSCGYSWRDALSVAEIGRLASFVKEIAPQVVCFVDNCYGEFVETAEPTEVGIDLMAGSLIKNPGGGLAPSGGYLAGRQDLVTGAADQLVAPGLGTEMGTNLGLGHLFYQGLFISPQIVGEALRGAIFASHFFKGLGFPTAPKPGAHRADIVQAVRLGSPEGIMAFCRGIQAAAPVDSQATPEPGVLPGYQDRIIMAAGTFNQGASIELSADAPMREPYIAYVQGGLSYAHALTGYLRAAQELWGRGLVSRA